jgi:hypothetical protein
MGTINKEWHLKNRMPQNPSPEQRIVWHIGHAANCTCRPVPEKLKAEIAKYKRRLPR